MDLLLLLRMAADAFGERIALGSLADGVSYQALLDRASSAGALIADGDHSQVAYCGFNGPAFPVGLFAAAFAGLPFAPLNYRLPDANLRKLAGRTAPSLLVADPEMAARLVGLDGVELISPEALLAAAPAEMDTEADPDAIALLLFTSGTTGEPKAAVLRHRHMAAYVLQTVEFMGADETEAALISVPPYHIAGVMAVLSSLYAGRRIVQLPAFEAEAWVRLARDEAVTHAMLAPTMLARVLEVLERDDVQLPALRHLSYGGGRMPLVLIERVMARLPQVDFVNAYGLTETSSTIAILDPDDHRRAFGASDPAAHKRLGSVGRPLPSVEVEIRGPEGELQAAGAVGEIWVRGEQVAGEYLERRAVRDDGWLPTNDSGWIDEAGYLFVEGRLDDVIVRGAENISPGEIEDVLRAHPAVRDAAVVGVPDEAWGERIAAFVVLSEPVGEAALKDWTRARLRSTKTPDEIHLRDELPFNELGKLLRRVLKQDLTGPAKTV